MDGNFDEASRLYLQLHHDNPRDEEVLYLIGVLCCDLSKYVEACRFLDEALMNNLTFPEATRQLSIALKGLAKQQVESGQYDAASPTLARALDMTPNDEDLRNWQGLAHLQRGQFAQAEQALRLVLTTNPRLTQARNNLGIALYEQGKLEEARACYQLALEQQPAYANARVNLANTLRVLGRPLEARKHFEKLLATQPKSAEILNNYGATLQDLGEPKLARKILESAVALAPHSPQTRWNLSLSELQLGDYANGWRDFEARWEGCGNLRNAYGKPAQLAWRGEALQGKRILLWAEQGFGDTLQFIRFASDVAQHGATVLVEVQPELASLIVSVQGVTQVVSRGEALPPYDVHCPLMSLPYYLEITSTDVVERGAYLSANADRIAHWHAQLADFPGKKIGFTWAGKSRLQHAELAAIDARRSIKFQQLAPLMQVEGASFFSLQKDAPAEARDSLNTKLHDYSGEWKDFSDTAAFIANLDLVITVDTAVAHLAGALGKPVWLLNRHDSCWRWLQGRNDSPWYPSLRQFRQERPGNWEPVIARMAVELQSFLPNTSN